MKKQILCWTMGLACFAVVSIAAGPQSSGIPTEVCQALEQYVAEINYAGAVKDKAQREEKYAGARNALAPVLKKHNKESLLAQAAEFAEYTELTAGTDPTDPKFGELLQKRINSGAALQGLCMSYTTSR
jgi:hypothetical protein